MAGKVICIICGKEKKGIPIKEDRIIRLIRWLKANVTKSERYNTLVVCKEDYQTYNKYRKRYTSRQTLYLALGVIFFILGNLIAFSISTFLATIAVLCFFYLLSLLNYTPALDLGEAKKKP